MSYLVDQDAVCPHCQHPNEGEVWSAIDVKEDPELKDLLLGGEINLCECVSCKEVFYIESFLLYHDRERELMAFVYPLSYAKERAQWEQKTKADFDQIQSALPEAEKQRYAPVTLFGIDELVFLVEDEEENILQAEIVALLAKQCDYHLVLLAQSVARQKKLPPVIPYIGGNGQWSRDNVLKALEKLKSVNDRLFVYTKLEEFLRNDASWVLDTW